jgi:hypothetical protein
MHISFRDARLDDDEEGMQCRKIYSKCCLCTFMFPAAFIVIFIPPHIYLFLYFFFSGSEEILAHENSFISFI